MPPKVVVAHTVFCRHLFAGQNDYIFLRNINVYIKGTVQRDFHSVFLHLWIGLGLNKDRFWF
jgi:chemotaxis methyl-accepting protein methylase